MIKIIKLKTLLICILFGSCVSLNSHQTGRTLGENNSSVFTNFNFGDINNDFYKILQDSGPLFYISEIGVLHGVNENFDLGLKVNSSFNYSTMCKYQFIGDNKSFFSSSLGLDIGATLPSVIMSVIGYNSSFSLYNSIHPTDYLSLTFSPRYTYLGFTNFMKKGFTTRDNIYGYSAGVIIGRKHKFSFELSQYVNNTNFSFSTKPIISLGYKFTIKR